MYHRRCYQPAFTPGEKVRLAQAAVGAGCFFRPPALQNAFSSGDTDGAILHLCTQGCAALTGPSAGDQTTEKSAFVSVSLPQSHFLSIHFKQPAGADVHGFVFERRPRRQGARPVIRVWVLWVFTFAVGFARVLVFLGAQLCSPARCLAWLPSCGQGEHPQPQPRHPK